MLVRTGSAVKYCIGCVHCVFESGSRGYSSTFTHDPSEDAKLFCAAEHWRVEMKETTQAAFARFMESAETCADFTERPAPPAVRGMVETVVTITTAAAMRRGIWPELCCMKDLSVAPLPPLDQPIELTIEEARRLGIGV